LDTQDALTALEQWDLRPRALHRKVQRKHIFTHIQWQMLGYYLEVAEPAGDFVWMTGSEINATAALPTAFRQFWEDIYNV
jgi:A/G-specific adenine glycosylase